MKVPCKGCKDRLIPKTCESSCDRWNTYKAEAEIIKNARKEYWYAKLHGHNKLGDN